MKVHSKKQFDLKNFDVEIPLHSLVCVTGVSGSGKSTLMNAISGTYVSEVTSLPGYPCLVFVRNSDKPKFSITRYNGRESNFPDSIVLNDVVAEAHDRYRYAVDHETGGAVRRERVERRCGR